MKNKTFIQSVKCAISGLIYALRTEKNYKYYFAIYLITLGINMIFKISSIGYIVQLIMTTGVFGCECLNTSIEHLMNIVDESIRPEIKIVKDVAAGSVLCWGIGYFTSWIIFLVGVV